MEFSCIHHAAGGSLKDTRRVKSTEESTSEFVIDQPKSRSKTLPHNVLSNLEVSITCMM